MARGGGIKERLPAAEKGKRGWRGGGPWAADLVLLWFWQRLGEDGQQGEECVSVVVVVGGGVFDGSVPLETTAR